MIGIEVSFVFEKWKNSTGYMYKDVNKKYMLIFH